VHHPAIVEERDSEGDLISERFNCPAGYVWAIAVQERKLRPNDFKHQYDMFSVWPVYLELAQGSEDVIGSRVCPWLGRKNVVNLGLVVPVGRVGYDEFEGDVSATRRENR